MFEDFNNEFIQTINLDLNNYLFIIGKRNLQIIYIIENGGL